MDENDIILNVTEANYADTVAANPKLVLLAIGAPWCVDCRRIQPMFQEFAAKYQDKIQFAFCDFDKEAGLNSKFRVRHIPTLILLRKGEILDTLVEPKDVKLFEAFIQKALSLV